MEFAKSLGRANYKANSIEIGIYHEITYCFAEKQCVKMQSITPCHLTARVYFIELLTFPPLKKLVKHRKFCRLL